MKQLYITVMVTFVATLASTVYSADEESAVEEVVVTGSQIKGAKITGALPVSVITGIDIEAIAAPALVTKSNKDSPEVSMLKTTILALQSALETSLHEKNTLINHNNALQSRLSTSVTAINFAKFLQIS